MIMNNNYCKKCRLRDGCLQKCKEAEIYEQGYHDAVKELKKLKKTTMENKYKLWVARDKNGFLFAYEDKPTRCDNQKEWIGRFLCSMKNSYFPELKWEDEPIEIGIRPAITDLDEKAEEYANNVTDNEELREIIVNAFKAGYNA